MASILPGFEFDIFISYRHNDNLPTGQAGLDGWVTDFVMNLEKELKATLKDSVTIYFDKNPRDGLLESHNVDKSLEAKLKSLIFIPIISQTYCDTKSFAWQHELCAFNTWASKDHLGRDVKLTNGNIASRILPIKIHDLDAEDKSLVEKELGGILRAIEFIYREPGVNRPLKSTDIKSENQNKTDYRNQLNKVANAIKEIVQAAKNPKADIQGDQGNPRAITPRKQNRKFALVASTILIVLVAGYFLYAGLNTHTPESVMDKSIAVLPFVNMSNDPEQEYFSDGISEEVLNLLAKVPELKVIGRTSSFYFKGKNEDLRVIGEKLGAAHLLEGSVRRDGNTFRITAQLIRAVDGTHLWSETYDRKMESVFELQDEIANNVLRELKLKLLGKSEVSAVNNQELQNLILKGKYFAGKGEYLKATGFYQEALALDSGNASTWTSLAQMKIIFSNANYTKDYDENYRLAKLYANKAIALDKNSSNAHRIFGVIKMFSDHDWKDAEDEMKLALKLDPNNSDGWRNLGQLKLYLKNYVQAEEYIKKSIEVNPLNFVTINTLSRLYFYWGKFDKAIQTSQEAIELNADLGRQQLFDLYIVSHQPKIAKQLLDEITSFSNDWDKILMEALVDYEMGHAEESFKSVTHSLIGYEGGSYRVARVFAWMNKNDEAIQWLEKTYQEKFGMLQPYTDPLFTGLYSDPRFREILKKAKFPVE